MKYLSLEFFFRSKNWQEPLEATRGATRSLKDSQRASRILSEPLGASESLRKSLKELSRSLMEPQGAFKEPQGASECLNSLRLRSLKEPYGALGRVTEPLKVSDRLGYNRGTLKTSRYPKELTGCFSKIP